MAVVSGVRGGDSSVALKNRAPSEWTGNTLSTSRRQSRFASSPSPAMANHSLYVADANISGTGKDRNRNQCRQVLSGVRGGDSSVACGSL